MNKLKQNGFSIVELLILLVVIGGVAFTGWYAWSGRSKPATPASSTNTQTVSSGSVKTSPTKTTSTQNLCASAPAIPTIHGAITGHLGYPAEGLPKMNVYLTPIIGSSVIQCFAMPLVGGADATAYRIETTPGDYYLYSRLQSNEGSFTPSYKAYYDEFVKCGYRYGCPDAGHKQYIKVTVTAGKTTSGIDPADWYDNSQL